MTLGSPPQVRGKHTVMDRRADEDRITPAGAGKTLRTVRGFQPSWDHPRRCGENWTARKSGLMINGSPPQVRGKLAVDAASARNSRITPAGAGKTGFALKNIFADWDHPRRCGENYWRQSRCLCWAGSPPQVRGKQTYMGYSFFNDRITPAGAGKTRRMGTAQTDL